MTGHCEMGRLKNRGLFQYLSSAGHLLTASSGVVVGGQSLGPLPLPKVF